MHILTLMQLRAILSTSGDGESCADGVQSVRSEEGEGEEVIEEWQFNALTQLKEV